MDEVQDLDAVTEAEGRRLLATAFETVPAGTVLAGHRLAGDGLAGDGPAGVELLRRVRRQTSRPRRPRALVPAGAVAALGGAAALGLTLTTTVASAPSAFAAVTAAAAKTSAQSFRVTEIQATKGMPAASGHDKLPPPQITGGFDPEHGLGEEIVAGRIQVRFVGGHMYAQVGASPLSHGKPWVETPTPPPPFDGRSGIAETFNGSEIAEGFYGNEPIDPAVLLGLLKSAGSVRAAGPVSGPGWTGTKYVFTIQPPKATAATYATSGIVYVDNQGRVRRLMTIFTWSEPVSPQTGNHVAHTYTHSFDVTFGDFGVPVSVTAPPASQVYNFSGRGLPAVIWLDILG
jgi:hypothetical protein